MIKITTDKKLNRIDRLSEYREMKLPAGVNRSNGFYIEVSTKAFKKLQKLNRIPFNVCHDFDTGLFWIVIGGEGSNKHFDFTYLMTGEMNTEVNGWDVDKMVCIDFDHIDVSTTWGLIEGTVELLGEWLDKKYGNDCGFKRNFHNLKLDYALNKPTNLGDGESGLDKRSK